MLIFLLLIEVVETAMEVVHVKYATVSKKVNALVEIPVVFLTKLVMVMVMVVIVVLITVLQEYVINSNAVNAPEVILADSLMKPLLLVVDFRIDAY